MRNRIRPLVLALSLLACPALVWAQGPAANPGKVGVINIQAGIFSTSDGKKALAELQTKYQPRQQELQREQQEIQALNEQLQKQAATLSDEEQVRLKRQLDEKQKLFSRAQDDFNSDAQTDRQEVTNRIGQKMLRLMGEYAQQNGYVLIMEAGPQMPIYYVAPQVDLTEEMVKRYDVAYPVDAAGTLSPGAGTSTAPATRPAHTPSGVGTATPGARTPITTRPLPKPPDKPKP